MVLLYALAILVTNGYIEKISHHVHHQFQNQAHFVTIFITMNAL